LSTPSPSFSIDSPWLLSIQLLSDMGYRSRHWLEIGALVLREPLTG
jgi:hypothetical protein